MKSFKLLVEPKPPRYLTPETMISLPGKPGPTGPPGPDGVNVPQSKQTDRSCFKGQPLYTRSSGNLDLAQANSLGTSKVAGLALNNASGGTSVNYELDGVVTQSDWTQVIGQTNLSPGSTYFLSPAIAGKLTTIAPEVGGELVVKVGVALDSSTLNLEIEPPILL